MFEEDNRVYSPLPRGIYGKGHRIFPHRPSKNSTPYDKEKFLESIDPLESYQHIIVLYSGGKDSIAATLYLRELGVPNEKILLMHHDIDGGNQELEMDWSVTKSYCIESAKALGIPIRFSWRQGGFLQEMLRNGASFPISFEDYNDSGKLITVSAAAWEASEKLRKRIEECIQADNEEEAERLMIQLRQYGYRMKFPAKSASLQTRWCSSSLKIEVFDKVLRYCDTFMAGKKILVIDGIRREESPNRSRYNECELHTTNAPRKQRVVHKWSPVIEWTEEMVWEIIERHRLRAHPCYYLGFSRCSCSCCIFGLPKHWAAIKFLHPEKFSKLVELERRLNFTIDSKFSLEGIVSNTASCLPQYPDADMIKALTSRWLPKDYIRLQDHDIWTSPYGAYGGAEGGPC